VYVEWYREVYIEWSREVYIERSREVHIESSREVYIEYCGRKENNEIALLKTGVQKLRGSGGGMDEGS
jgi:hypothetical protein